MPMSPHRLAKAGILVAIAVLCAIPALALAQAAPSKQLHPLVAEAAQYEGEYQGECWIFVDKVVKDALGLELGHDYRLGYLEAGAVEVSVAGAQPGDVVQIADDHYTEPDADYPGLHTFIISEVVALGVFNGWDSNSNWDGVVRFREQYEPAKAAGRYPNLNYRIYRFPTPENPFPAADELVGIPEKTWLPSVGDTAIVVAGGDSLNLRAGPGLTETVITQLRDGAAVTITGGPVRAFGHTWVSVSSSAGSGWVASEYLAKSTGGSDTKSAATVDGTSQPLSGYRTMIPFIAVGN